MSVELHLTKALRAKIGNMHKMPIRAKIGNMHKMPIRAKFSQEELASAVHDRAELARVIAISGGYALGEMRKLGLTPHLDDLMAVINGDSLSFVLDHYELDLKQKRAIAHLFAEQLGSIKLAGAELTESEINARLDAGQPWVKGAQITRAQLEERPAEIAAVIDACKDGEMELAVERAVVQMPADDVIRIDARVWESCLSVFRERSDVLALPEGKERYKRMMLAKAIKEGIQLRWCDFTAWSFESVDEAFFWSLIDEKAWMQPSFEEIVAVPGCSAFIDKMGYAKRVRPGSIKALNSEELAEKMQEVRQIWLDICVKQKGHMTPVSFEASSAQFEAVVDVAWMSHALREIPGLASRLEMGEDREARTKGHWARRQVLMAFLEDPEAIVAVQGTGEIVSMAGLLLESHKTGSQGALSDALSDAQIAQEAIHTVVPFCIDAREEHGAACLMNPSHLSGDSMFGALAKASQSNPSANLLWILLTIARDRVEGSHHCRHGMESYLELACQASLGVAHESGGLLWDALAPEARQRLTPQFKGSCQTSNPRTDLIGVCFDTLFDLPSLARRALMKVHPNFAKKMHSARLRPDSEMLLWALRDVDKLSEASVTLFCELLSLVGPSGLECPKLEVELRAHPLSAVLVNNFWLPSYQGTQSRALETADALQEARCAQSVWEGAVKKGLMQADAPKSKAMAVEVSRLNASGLALFGALPHEQARKALIRALNQGRYALFEDCARWREAATGAKSMWEAHLGEMPIDVFCKALGDTAFAQMVHDSVSYKDVCTIGLDFKSKNDNARACEMMLPLFETDSCGALALFSLAARKEFASDFVVRKMASQAVYNYKLMPGRDGLMPGFYDSDQIIQLFDHLEADQGFFCTQDVNARVESMFRENFGGRSIAYLDVLARSCARPKLYTLLFNSDLCDQFGDERESHNKAEQEKEEQVSEPRQAAGVRWAADHIDWNVIARGIELILDEAWTRRAEYSFNSKLALDAARAPIWGSRARGKKELAGDPDGYALISEAMSLRLANILLQKAPLLFYATQSIGAIADLPTHFIRNPGAFDCTEMVERLFCPDRAVRPQHFNLRNWAKDSVVSIGRATVQWLAGEGRANDLQFINWMIKEVGFRSDELAYGAQKLEVPGFERSTNGVLECCAQSPEFMEVLRVIVEKLSLEDFIDNNSKKRRARNRL